MPDPRVPTSLSTALKQLREELAHVNATIWALECMQGGEKPSPKRQRIVKSGQVKAIPSEHADLIKPKQPAKPLADDYADIHLASLWSPDEDSWIAFMRNVIRLPMWMLPVVQRVIRRRAWRKAAFPIEQIRAASNREIARLGLRGE
jgi:hypothetical protein